MKGFVNRSFSENPACEPLLNRSPIGVWNTTLLTVRHMERVDETSLWNPPPLSPPGVAWPPICRTRGRSSRTKGRTRSATPHSRRTFPARSSNRSEASVQLSRKYLSTPTQICSDPGLLSSSGNVHTGRWLLLLSQYRAEIWWENWMISSYLL